MKKHIINLVVTENSRLNNQYILLKLTDTKVLPPILAGQFAQVKVDNSATTFLRRPISISYVDTLKNEIWLLVQIVGDGTRQLSKLSVGQTLNVILPLGNAFTLPKQITNKPLLVGGGVGVAPLLILGKELYEKGYKCNFLLGARSKNDLLLLDQFEKYGTIHTTTEDGSCGEKGYVTQHTILENNQFTEIYTCGPTPMMKAIATYAYDRNIYCEVSLENMMGCGFGACLCCVTDTTEGNLCVCTEGPVFNIKKLKWQI